MHHQTNEAASADGASLGNKLRRRRRWPFHGDAIVIVLSATVMTALYLLAYKRHPSHPHIDGNPGWWSWFDQPRYFNAAAAWSRGDLDPAQHWYLPGYPLMGAPFVKLLSVHAFVIPNLICLLASLWLFCKLTGRLAPAIPHAGAYGAVLFAAVTTVSPLGLDIWVVPWSTTGTVPLFYACLLAALCFIEQPSRVKFAFVTGLTGGLVAAFRAIDAVPLLLACAIGMAVALLRQWHGWKPAIAAAAAGAAGVTVALGVLAAAYLPVFGPHESDYISGSGVVGFDWGLVGLHWVTLVLDPRPLLNEGQGLIEAFPWIIGGLAGFAVFLVLPARKADRLAHATIILAATFYVLVYLAYRDLHPDGLFRFWNYHYFKWVYPVLALYAGLLLHALLTETGRRLAILGVALFSLCLLLPWRAELHVIAPAPGSAVAIGDHAVRFDGDLTSVRDGLLVAAAGEWDPIYFGPHALAISGRTYLSGVDFKLFPRSAGFLLTPLRPLVAGPARLVLNGAVKPDPSGEPLLVRQDLLFGLPCWLPQVLHSCAPEYLLPPPPLPAGGNLVFDGTEAPYLTGGWFASDAIGRWTDGDGSGLRLRLAAPASNIGLTIEGSAYVPAGAAPLEIHVLVNGREVLVRHLATGETVPLEVALFAGRFGLPAFSGTMQVTLRIANPRRPMDYDTTSTDARNIGFFVRKISVAPLPAE